MNDEHQINETALDYAIRATAFAKPSANEIVAAAATFAEFIRGANKQPGDAEAEAEAQGSEDEGGKQ